MNDFMIYLHSLHFPGRSDDAELSRESYETIRLLHDSLRSAHLSSTAQPLIEMKLENSIFACCVPEGYIMLKCTIKREVELHGFLLRKDESLRTVWKLSRWQILLLCAGGWTRTGTVASTIEEINTVINKMQFKEDYQESLLKVGQQIMASEVPYNFALTGYSLSRLPLDFTKGSIEMNAGGPVDLKNGIVWDQATERRHFETMSNSAYKSMDMRLVYITAKEYISNTEKLWSFSPQLAKEKKEEAKALMSSYSSNMLWCIRHRYNDDVFLMPLDYQSNQMLTTGSLRYANIIMLFNRSQKETKKYLDMKREYLQPQQTMPSIDAPPKGEEKGKKGFFGRFHK